MMLNTKTIVVAFLSVTTTISNIVHATDKTDVVGFSTLWYRPHHECGWNDNGSTASTAADFINGHMNDGGNGIDFVGISEYGDNDRNPIGTNTNYGSIGAVCGSHSGKYVSPIVLFYNKERWNMVDSYPKSEICLNAVPSASSQDQYDCHTQITPSDDKCCSCTYSKEEIRANSRLGQRPWVAGKFTNKNGSGAENICIVIAAMAHRKDSVGTMSQEVSSFCGNDSSIVFMADTNFAKPSENTSNFFATEPLVELKDYSGGDLPYTCCNDTFKGKPINSNASDRIAVTGNLSIDDLEGGSTAPGLDMPVGLSYKCHNKEEHAPLLAHISFGNKK